MGRWMSNWREIVHGRMRKVQLHFFIFYLWSHLCVCLYVTKSAYFHIYFGLFFSIRLKSTFLYFVLLWIHNFVLVLGFLILFQKLNPIHFKTRDSKKKAWKTRLTFFVCKIIKMKCILHTNVSKMLFFFHILTDMQ